MQVAAMRSPWSATKTWTPGCVSVSCQICAARSGGSAVALTSAMANSAKRDGRSELRAKRAVGIAAPSAVRALFDLEPAFLDGVAGNRAAFNRQGSRALTLA